MLSTVLALVLPLSAQEPSLDSVRDLLAITEAYQAHRPIGKDLRERAWSALWASEKVLPPEVIERLRRLLLRVDEQRGSLRGIAAAAPAPQAPWASPDADERNKLYKRVDRLRYPPEVKTLLSLIVEYATIDDSRLAVDVVRAENPAIRLEARELPLDTVGGVSRGRAGPTIRLRPGVALLPAGKADETGLELSAGGARWHPIPASESYYRRLSAPVPALDVFLPGARSHSAGAYYGGEIFVYPDGSGYHRFSNEHLAGVLLHELLHLDTRRRGGGASEEADELRSFLAQYRMYYNLHKRLGTADFLDMNRQGYANWLDNPVSLGYFLEAAYSAGPRSRHEPGGVMDAIAETRRLLSLPPADFQEAKRIALERRLAEDDRRRRSELEYLAKLGLAPQPPALSPPDAHRLIEAAKGWDYRAELESELSRLANDARLELAVRLEDFSWRESEGIEHPSAVSLKQKSFER